MTEAEVNQAIRNNIANISNRLLEQASPFPCDKLEYTQECVHNAIEKLSKLYTAIKEYNDKHQDNLLKQL